MSITIESQTGHIDRIPTTAEDLTRGYRTVRIMGHNAAAASGEVVAPERIYTGLTPGVLFADDEATDVTLLQEARLAGLESAAEAVEALEAGDVEAAKEVAHVFAGEVFTAVGMDIVGALPNRRVSVSDVSEEVRFVGPHGDTITEIIRTDDSGVPKIQIMSNLHNTAEHGVIELRANLTVRTDVEVFVHSHERGIDAVPVTNPEDKTALMDKVLNDLGVSLQNVSANDDEKARSASRRHARLV